MDALASCGARLDAKDALDRTLLQHAVRDGQADVVIRIGSQASWGPREARLLIELQATRPQEGAEVVAALKKAGINRTISQK